MLPVAIQAENVYSPHFASFFRFLAQTFHNWLEEWKVFTVNHGQIRAEWAQILLFKAS